LQFDLTFKHPLTNNLELQFSVQNLFNTNDFNYLPMPNAGTTTSLGELNSAGNFALTSLPSTLVPAPPRTLRMQLRWHDGTP